MTSLTSLLGGLFAASAFLSLFRVFFTEFEFPVFHLAAVFLIVTVEIALWIALSKKSKPDSVFSFPALVTWSILYLPLSVCLVMLTRPVFGLDFISTLPWYAVIIYPLFILFPLAGAAGRIFIKYILNGTLKTSAFFTGFFLFSIADLLFFHSYVPLNLALLSAFFGFALLLFYHSGWGHRSLYAVLSLMIFFVLYSGYADSLYSFLREFEREFQSEFLESRTTPYGEITAHLTNNDSLRISVNHIPILGQRNAREVNEHTHLTMLQYPWAERILLIGQDPRIIKEILRYPDISSVYWASPVPGAQSLVQEHLSESIPESEVLRILRTTEGRDFTERFAGENFFDVIVVSLPDPANLFLNRYYTGEFFERLKSISHKHSIISMQLEAGDRRLRQSKQLLSATVYKTLKNYFPNGLTIYGRRSLILASDKRGFTTSPLPLAEYMQTVEDIPEYISPSLLQYKLDSREKVLEQIDIPAAPLNSDFNPASLKYSFNEMIYTLGLWRGFLVHMTDRVKPLWVYSLFLFAVCAAIFQLKKKDDNFKILSVAWAGSFIFIFFIWNMSVLLHSYSGRLYSLITLIILSASAGVFVSLKYHLRKGPTASYSRISTFLVMTALFFIFVTVYFEFSLSVPTLTAASIITFAGSFFLMSALYSAFLSFSQKKTSFLIYSLSASALAFGGAVFILPVMGLTEVFPLNIILLLGLVFLLNTQQSV